MNKAVLLTILLFVYGGCFSPKTDESLLECLLHSYVEELDIGSNARIMIVQTDRWSIDGEFSHIQLIPLHLESNFPLSGAFTSTYEGVEIVYYSGEVRENQIVRDSVLNQSTQIDNFLQWTPAYTKYPRSFNTEVLGNYDDFQFLYAPKDRCLKFTKTMRNPSLISRIRNSCTICVE